MIVTNLHFRRCVFKLVLSLSIIQRGQGEYACVGPNKASAQQPCETDPPISLLGKPANVIGISFEGSGRCCYSYTEACHEVTSHGLTNWLNDGNDQKKCNLKHIDEWHAVSTNLYQSFKVVATLKDNNDEIEFTVRSCNESATCIADSTTTNHTHHYHKCNFITSIDASFENLQKEIEDAVNKIMGGLIKHSVTQTNTELLESLKDFDEFIVNLTINNAGHKTTKLSVPDIAEVEFGQIPDVNYIFTSEPDGSTQLLEFSSIEGRGKRSPSLIVFVFTQFIFELSKMRPFYVFRDTTSSFWQIANYTSIHPSTVAPYIKIQANTNPGGTPVRMHVSFNVNMTNIIKSFHTRRLHGKSVNGVVTCSCDEPGFFTVTPQIIAQVRPDGLENLFIGGSSAGLMLLFVTSVSLIRFSKRVKCDRIAVQITLLCSLFLLHFVILFEKLPINRFPLCEVVTFLCHYFVKATGLLALADGATILANLNPRSLRFKRLNPGLLLTIQLAVCWGIPLIISGVTIAVALPQVDYILMSEYGYERCWIKHDSSIFVAAVIVPIATIFIACFLLAILIGAFASSAKRNHQDAARQASGYEDMTVYDVDMDHVFRMLVEYVMTCIVLLVPWIKYFIPGIHNIDVTLANMYVTVMMISLQGVFVFIIYVIVSRDGRRAFVGKTLKNPERYKLYWYGPRKKPKPNPLDGL